MLQLASNTVQSSRKPRGFFAGCLVVGLLSFACDPRVCRDPSAATRLLPARLSQTGLLAPDGSGALADGVAAYTPAYALWSDGLDKRRFVFVPPGQRVDTSDPETWHFPAGTKLWKEFATGGRPLETRLLYKAGAGDAEWLEGAYVWDADGRDAVLAPYGALDVGGSGHDVPAAGECSACHGGRASRVLGFSAVQLAPGAGDGSEHLAPAAAQALLSTPLEPLVPPGDATERAALGYLHANCSHCHNQSAAARSEDKCLNPNEQLGYDLDFTLHPSEFGAVAATATYRTALGKVVTPGHPGDSELVDRVSSGSMPPIATSKVDAAGVALLRTWVARL